MLVLYKSSLDLLADDVRVMSQAGGYINQTNINKPQDELYLILSFPNM